MAGLNSVTGTGRQTVEELKKAIKNLDGEVINTLVGDLEQLQTNMTTAQENITQLDTGYQALDARVGSLESGSGSSEDTMVTVGCQILGGNSVKIINNSGNTMKEFLSPIITITEGSITSDELGGGDAVTEFFDANNQGSGYFQHFHYLIKAGITKFRIYTKMEPGRALTRIIALNDDGYGVSNDKTGEANWCTIGSTLSQDAARTKYRLGKKITFGPFTGATAMTTSGTGYCVF